MTEPGEKKLPIRARTACPKCDRLFTYSQWRGNTVRLRRHKPCGHTYVDMLERERAEARAKGLLP